MKSTWVLPGVGKLKPLHQDDQVSILYAVELNIPTVFDDNKPNGIQYKSSKHIFTENEINRACVRFFAETGDKLRRKMARGYVGVTTFINNQGTMVTRYIVNMQIPATGVQTMLFSAREFQRSIERFNILCPAKPTFMQTLCGMFKKK